KPLTGNGLNEVFSAAGCGKHSENTRYLVHRQFGPVKQALKNNMAIQFGTSGWRAVIADEFTFAGVRSVTGAICSHFGSKKATNDSMVVGYDTRFLGERFARECADIVAANDFQVLLCDGPVPTPTLSHAIRTRKAGCG